MAEATDVLTPEQQKTLDEYVKEHIGYVLSTAPANRKVAEHIWAESSKVLGINHSHVEWCLSPIQAAWLAIYHSAAQATKANREVVEEKISPIKFPADGAAVDDRFRMPVTADLKATCERIIRREFGITGHAPKKLADLMERVLAFTQMVLGDRSLDLHWLVDQFMMGQQTVSWWWHYQFYERHLGHKFSEEHSQLIGWLADLGRHTGWWLIFGDTIYACERMAELHVTPEYRLHRDGGPAIAFRDDLKIYLLNNVIMEPEHVLTPADDLTPEMILNNRNVDQQRELLAKMGMARFAMKSGAEEVDKESFTTKDGRTHEYSLLMINVADRGKRPYLKMLNPSEGEYHVEGVPPHVKTVREAIHERKDPRLKAIPVDDEHGESYQQQGDTLYWNPNAKSVKFFPDMLS